ncbi:hypothetical protein PHMEG_00012833 [Phytophthora megakarya]|uniref:Uncharacterized protein n=1 Tax=Phytophthora megakarya TaxID=4795 RepID=A0A225W7T3_9STRA|nr:hypothetical protein PHMEG_00012833 [Phytophthora megakarya]
MLAEALAFIDECDSNGKPVKTRTSKKPGVSKSVVSRKPQKLNKTQPRVGESQCYSTQLQQRKKAELRALREQALEMEEQVKLLLQRRQQRQKIRADKEKNPVTQNHEDDSHEWFQKAVGEFQRRQKAERKNRKLKEIWANQNKVNGAFRHLVQRRSLLYGKDFVFEDEENTTTVEDETMKTISCNTRVKRSSDTNGNCIEILTTTPVSCPLNVAADVVWKDLNVKSQDPERIYSFIRGRKPDSLEKNFLIALHNPSGVLKIDGFQFMRKFEEPDRVVVIKHNMLTLPHMGLKFLDRCWIIISRSKSDPTHAAVARTCYQLYAEGSDKFASNEDIVHTRDYILSSLSGKVRRDHQIIIFEIELMTPPKTRAETKRQRSSSSKEVKYDSEHSEQLYAALTTGAMWFLEVKDMVQLLGTCRTLRHDQSLGVLALSNCSVGMHLLHGCNGDWMDLSLERQQDALEESFFWSECREHTHVARKKEINCRLVEDKVPLDFSTGQAAQMLSLIGKLESHLKPFYSRAYVATPFGEFCRPRPVVVPLPARADKVPSETWTVEDARIALNSLWDRFGDDFVASNTEYVHVSDLGMHWENITVGKKDTKKCHFCDAAKKAVREYRKEAKALMDEFLRVLKDKQKVWRAEGLDDDEMHERRSLLKADMFPEDAFPDANAAESSVDDILAHICEHDKFPVVPFEGMASELERKNDDIFNALALECQDLCETLYQPLKQKLSAAVAFSGQRVYRPWMDTGEETTSIRRELIAGLATNGFLIGVYVMKAVEDFM